MTAVLEPPAATLAPVTPDTVTDLVELYKGRRDRLVGYAARFAGGRDQGEDAVQDAFLALLTNPEQVRNAAAYVGAHARGRALSESSRRGQQVPVGDAMDWQPDTAPPAEDLDTLAACMGDPATARAVDEALARLPERQAHAIRQHLLENRPVSAVAETLGIDKSTVYRDVNAGLETLRGMNVEVPKPIDEPAPQRPSGSTPHASDAELVATLDQEFPGKWIGPGPAEELLRRVHGKCSTVRAVRAQKRHNERCEKPPSKNRATGAANGAGKRALADGTAVAPALPAEPAASESAVSEVWLMGAKPPISCLLVRTDETTSPRDLAAVSMAGAQREITGQLIADGYRPDGPWVDVDPAGPEAMRKFYLERGQR
ncbi:RNA polymerase sigma factor [Dactylosporangium sp. NPDC051484]|uniref:RNA polymerase sigma factor n=1 Tax=Dactylosporangium sp. NPDC051484 TaxID=3154942 RepID=UPI00345057BE